jgi:TolB-like protein/tetratricopeptide (TPR) repeat protein
MSELQIRLRAALAGRYAIERELGRGGMATVYLAHDLKHHRLVALKVLRLDLAAALGPGRFLREIEIAARLAHPHILPLHDSGEAGGFLYYVMPYVEGASLRTRLMREGQLPLDQALEIAREVADALSYAHSHDVVHRDIKPENILFEGGHAVVADFGIARAITVAGGDHLTESGIAVGTPAYMSPEQASAEARIDGRSDIYALGCVLYEMLAGEPPFTGPTAQAVAAKHLGQPVPSIRVSRATIPAEIDDVIRTALAKAPADRYVTAAQFAAALETRRAERPHLFPRSWPGIVLYSASVLGVAVGARWAWQRWTDRGTGLPVGSARVRPAQTHVAVLYFDTDADNPKLQLVANGLTQDLIDQLGQVEGLQVVSASGVRPYRDHPVSLDSIVTALSVGTIVAGTLSGSPERPSLVVRLVDALTGRQLDSKRLEATSGDVLALRNELIQEVTLFLRERLGKEILQKELRAGTRNPEAWIVVGRVADLRQDAATLYAAGDTTASHHALDTADSLLGVAQRLDPSWVDPIVLAGWVAADRIELAVGATAPAVRRWAPQGLSYAERALARKPKYPPALELRGYLRSVAWQYSGRPDPNDLVAAERDLRAAAVPENPSQARAWSSLSSVLESRGSFAEANLAAQRAYETDAFLAAAPAVMFRLYLTSLMLRRWKETVEWCARGYARFPNDWLFTFCRLSLLYEPSRERPDAAAAWRLVAELERVTAPSERPVLAPRWRMLVAGVLARAGQQDSARRTLNAAKNSAGGDPEMGYYEAGVHVLLGEHEQAVNLLERYLAYSPQLRPEVERDPVFEPLHAKSRFRALVTEPNR